LKKLRLKELYGMVQGLLRTECVRFIGSMCSLGHLISQINPSIILKLNPLLTPTPKITNCV